MGPFRPNLNKYLFVFVDRELLREIAIFLYKILRSGFLRSFRSWVAVRNKTTCPKAPQRHYASIGRIISRNRPFSIHFVHKFMILDHLHTSHRLTVPAPSDMFLKIVQNLCTVRHFHQTVSKTIVLSAIFIKNSPKPLYCRPCSSKIGQNHCAVGHSHQT